MLFWRSGGLAGERAGGLAEWPAVRLAGYPAGRTMLKIRKVGEIWSFRNFGILGIWDCLMYHLEQKLKVNLKVNQMAWKTRTSSFININRQFFGGLCQNNHKNNKSLCVCLCCF